VFFRLYLSRWNLLYRSIIITLQDIQNFPSHCKKCLNVTRKFRSADTTGDLNPRRLKVNIHVITDTKYVYRLALHPACICVCVWVCMCCRRFMMQKKLDWLVMGPAKCLINSSNVCLVYVRHGNEALTTLHFMWTVGRQTVVTWADCSGTVDEWGRNWKHVDKTW
jgi:hypothetical protein